MEDFVPVHNQRRVAHVIPDPGGGGIYTFYTAGFGRSNAKQFCCVAIDANPFSMRRHDSSSSHNALPPSLSHYLAVAREAHARAVATGVDIIETCDWPLGFVPAVIEQRMPYIVQCHGSMGQIAGHDTQEGAELEEALVQLVEPQLLRYAHRMQTYSYANKRFWEEATGRSVEMIRPAFPLPPLPGNAGIDDVGRAFGRLQRWKGPHILCEAIRLLGSRAPQIHWYGGVKSWKSGDCPADRRLARDFPGVWGESFHHRNAIPRDEVFHLQASALFNVIPSTWDVFNFTAVESMAAARPTIVSTGAGASELIVDGENGFTFENENAQALAAVLDRVLSMPEARRREIGSAGRETIRVELDPVRIAEQRAAAYEEAILSFQAGPPKTPHDWLNSLLSSRPGENAGFGAFLSPVPLRAMARHMGQRMLVKLYGKESG